MNLIAAADKNWGIGYKNELLIKIPEDMKFFREMTTGNVVIAGRKTFESFPEKEALKNRVNIVLTGRKDYIAKGAYVAHDIEAALNMAKKYPSDCIFVTGGGSIYAEMIKYCDTAYITYIDYEYEADVHMPVLDGSAGWILAVESEKRIYSGIEYCFRKYVRKPM